MASTYGIHKDLGDEVDHLEVKASATWDRGAFLKRDSNGYIEVCGAGDIPIGVAADELVTADSPSSDGDITRPVYRGPNNYYRYPADSGTPTIAIADKKMDVGGARSVDIDASTNGSLICRDVIVRDGETLVVVQLNPAVLAGV